MNIVSKDQEWTTCYEFLVKNQERLVSDSLKKVLPLFPVAQNSQDVFIKNILTQLRWVSACLKHGHTISLDVSRFDLEDTGLREEKEIYFACLNELRTLLSGASLTSYQKQVLIDRIDDLRSQYQAREG